MTEVTGRNLKTRSVALFSGALIGLILAEVGLRTLGISNPRVSQRDDYCGTSRRPGAEWVYREEGSTQRIRVNSAGFRDVEWSQDKDADTVRIAVLGDSYAEALQTPTEQRFTEVLQQELRSKGAFGPKRVEVMNFGVSGYGTAQELMCLRHHVWQYAPDLVLLAVTTGNDVRNNSRGLQRDPGRPYFVFDDREFKLDDSFRRSADHIRTWKHELLYTLIDYSRMVQLGYATARSISEGGLVAREPGQEAGLDDQVYLEPTDEAWREAWENTEGLLELMNSEVRARKALFLVVTLSNSIQVHPNPGVRAAFSKRLGVRDLFYPERRIAAAGQRGRFPVLTLGPGLHEFARQRQVFLHGFGRRLGSGHWNEQGHRQAGLRIAERVRELASLTQ